MNETRTTTKNSQFKVIYRQHNRTNQWDFIVVDRWSDRRVGASFTTYRKAERYLMDCGFINSITLFPEFESIFNN